MTSNRAHYANNTDQRSRQLGYQGLAKLDEKDGLTTAANRFNSRVFRSTPLEDAPAAAIREALALAPHVLNSEDR